MASLRGIAPDAIDRVLAGRWGLRRGPICWQQHGRGHLPAKPGSARLRAGSASPCFVAGLGGRPGFTQRKRLRDGGLVVLQGGAHELNGPAECAGRL